MMPGQMPDIPLWGKIPPLRVSGRARLDQSGTSAIFPTEQGGLCLTLHDFGCRMRIGTHKNDYGILAETPQPLKINLAALENETVISSDAFRMVIRHNPFSFIFFKNNRIIQQSPTDAHFVRRFRLPPLARYNNGWLIGFELNADTPVYGLGEKWGRLDKRGEIVRSHNHDALGVNAEISYKNTPFCWSPEGWGIFVHTPFPVTHAVGYAPWSNRAYHAHIEDGPLDIFILDGATGAKLIDQYTQITGKADLPPEWSTGIILSRAYYKDAEQILSVARKVREKNMPCDVITFDGRAWQDTQTRFSFDWDASRYPNPKIVIDELKSMGFRICIWEYPMVSVNNPLFAEMESKGWLLKDAQGKTYRYHWDMEPFGKVLTPLPPSGIVDFTHPDAYAYWHGRHKELFDLGIDMIKADFGEQVTDDMIAHNGATGAELHNVYALLYNRCVYKAAKKFSKDGAFLFSRCGWAGSQRYPSLWGGDPQGDWGGLAASLRGGLSWGMSGGPFYATDVGGFYADTRDEILYVRWLQAAVFSAHLRLHGIGEREPWSYGPEAEEAANQALALRRKLQPYIWKTMQQAVETGLPVQRAMALACPDDPAAWSFENQFMLGDDIFFAPCLRADGKVRFYLPRGEWHHLTTNEKTTGGSVYDRTLGLREIIAFKKAGVP